MRQGTKLLVICLVNVSVAMGIGLCIMNTWQPGLAWNGHVDELLHLVPGSKPAGKLATSQTPIEDLAAYIPRTILTPFSTNNIIGVVFLAVCTTLARLAMRQDSVWASYAGESLTIAGWVAMWRPMQIYLYEWWPKIGRAHV